MADTRTVYTKESIKEILNILEYSKLFKKVSTGKRVPLTTETNFPSCYIKVDGTLAELNGNTGTSTGCEYDRTLVIRLLINMQLKDDLDFLDLQDKVESAILKDNLLWKKVLDRDFIGSEWDMDANYPKKEGEISFLIKFRSEV